MSLERIIKALIGLGLSRPDAEIYVLIAKKGPHKAVELDRTFNYSKNQIYTSLNNLTTKGLVIKKDTLLSSIPFEEALEMLIKKEKEQAKSIEDSKKELLVSWEES